MRASHRYFLQLFTGIIVLSGTASAQSYVEKMLSYEITAHYPDHLVVAHTKPSGEVKAMSDRKYHWFSANQIKVTEGGYGGKLLNGGYRDYYLSKNLKASGEFDEGLKTGIWKSWSENGLLQDQYTFRKGSLNGTYFKYDSLGIVLEKGSYQNNLLDGKQERASADTTIVVYYKDGKVTRHKSIVPKFITNIFPKKPGNVQPHTADQMKQVAAEKDRKKSQDQANKLLQEQAKQREKDRVKQEKLLKRQSAIRPKQPNF